jgi:hypothetical protein
MTGVICLTAMAASDFSECGTEEHVRRFVLPLTFHLLVDPNEPPDM